DLVGVHETGVTHHVAAVRQINCEHRAAPVLDGTAPVIVQLLVIVRADVTAREDFLDVLEERRIYSQRVFVTAMGRTVFNHQNVAVTLEDGRLDLADLLIEENADVASAIYDGCSRLSYAGRAKRIGLPRPAEQRASFLIGLEQRLIRPLGRPRRVRAYS